ncbi:MAG: hypothetical protein K8963_04210 [Proteobacteria bacterium]|nr:hypothetical protein [Pseudomonadota bacterium]
MSITKSTHAPTCVLNTAFAGLALAMDELSVLVSTMSIKTLTHAPACVLSLAVASLALAMDEPSA